MAETGVVRLPGGARTDGARLGVIELSDLLTARSRSSMPSGIASATSGRGPSGAP